MTNQFGCSVVFAALLVRTALADSTSYVPHTPDSPCRTRSNR